VPPPPSATSPRGATPDAASPGRSPPPYKCNPSPINRGIQLYSNPSPLTDMLTLFSKTSGLRTNVQKSSVLPIRCDEQTLATAKSLLPCQFADFPCKYLGLPLTLNKLPKSQVQTIVDRMASMLPGWKAELMNHAGRAIHVQHVMTAKVIYTAMAMELPS
jgi:hypothetical protein